MYRQSVRRFSAATADEKARSGHFSPQMGKQAFLRAKLRVFICPCKFTTHFIKVDLQLSRRAMHFFTAVCRKERPCGEYRCTVFSKKKLLAEGIFTGYRWSFHYLSGEFSRAIGRVFTNGAPRRKSGDNRKKTERRMMKKTSRRQFLFRPQMC